MSKLQGGDVLRMFAKQILNNSRCLKVFNKCKYIYIFRFCKCFGTFFTPHSLYIAHRLVQFAVNREYSLHSL